MKYTSVRYTTSGKTEKETFLEIVFALSADYFFLNAPSLDACPARNLTYNQAPCQSQISEIADLGGQWHESYFSQSVTMDGHHGWSQCLHSIQVRAG